MGEMNRDRIMLETRLTPDDRWYLDAHLRSGDSARTLIDSTKLHPTGEWYHAAFVVDRGAMRVYLNGRLELEGALPFAPLKGGSTSIGVRQNRRYWFKGAIRTVRVTPTCVTPSAFLK